MRCPTFIHTNVYQQKEKVVFVCFIYGCSFEGNGILHTRKRKIYYFS